MKKLFTLLAALLVVCSASAAGRYKVADMEAANAVVQQSMQQLSLKVAAGDTEGLSTYTWTDPATGDIWTCVLERTLRKWVDIVGLTDEDGNDATFEDFPFYRANAILYNNNERAYRQFAYVLFYPTKLAAGFAQPGDPDQYDVVTIDQWNENSPAFQIAEPGYVSVAGGNFAAFFSYSGGFFNSTSESCYIKPGSTIRFSGWDPEEESLNVTVEGSMVDWGATSWNDPVTDIPGTNYLVKFAGPVQQEGFIKVDKFTTLSELHVYNTGEASTKNLDFYEDDFGPLQRFVVLGLGEAYAIDSSASNKIVPNLFGDDGGIVFKDQAWLDKIQNDPKNPGLNIMRGAFYKQLNADDCYGTFKPAVIDLQQAAAGYWYTVGTPEADKFISSIFSTQLDGMGFADLLYNEEMMAMYNWTKFMDTEDMTLTIDGNKKAFALQGTDEFGNNVLYTYSGKVIYHYDPTDFTKTSEFDVEATGVEGVAAENAAIEAANGVIYVKATENTEVVVYNIAGVAVERINAAAGELVSVRPGNGLFIVKAGNAVKKVAL